MEHIDPRGTRRLFRIGQISRARVGILSVSLRHLLASLHTLLIDDHSPLLILRRPVRRRLFTFRYSPKLDRDTVIVTVVCAARNLASPPESMPG